MRKPKFNNILLADNGSVVLEGSSKVDVIKYPRSKGVLLTPSKIKESTVTLSCSQQRVSTVDRQEDLMHRLHEQLLSEGTGTLNIEGVEIQNCVPKSVSFEDATNKYMRYTIVFNVGSQNDYSILNQINFNQKNQYPTDFQFRPATFTVEANDGSNHPFKFGNYCYQLKSAEYDNITKLAAGWAYEYDSTINGGIETINLNGWIVHSSHKLLLNFMYNAIFGPLGLIGELQVGNNITTYAVFQNMTMQQIKGGCMYWNATFLSTLKC